jgi:hypothetical protein
VCRGQPRGSAGGAAIAWYSLTISVITGLRERTTFASPSSGMRAISASRSSTTSASRRPATRSATICS